MVKAREDSLAQAKVDSIAAVAKAREDSIAAVAKAREDSVSAAAQRLHNLLLHLSLLIPCNRSSPLSRMPSLPMYPRSRNLLLREIRRKLSRVHRCPLHHPTHLLRLQVVRAELLLNNQLNFLPGY